MSEHLYSAANWVFLILKKLFQISVSLLLSKAALTNYNYLILPETLASMNILSLFVFQN